MHFYHNVCVELISVYVSRSEVPSAGAKKKTKAPSASKMLVVGAKPRFVPTHSVMRTQLPEEAKAEIPLRHAETSSGLVTNSFFPVCLL